MFRIVRFGNRLIVGDGSVRTVEVPCGQSALCFHEVRDRIFDSPSETGKFSPTFHCSLKSGMVVAA